MSTGERGERIAASWRRTHHCGELRSADVGRRVVLNGWVAARRDHGGIYFVDLRDRWGITQLVIPASLADDLHLASEYVVSAAGEVVARDQRNVNPERTTGEIEVAVDRLEVLAESPTPPFEILDELDTAVETRLRYRYLDLRRPSMQRHLMQRSRFINAMRRAFEDEAFVEVETPILTRATPEGARDYLVPSRVHPGSFYALPQSPQIFKQLLMVSGLDRYFQVARCFRDEDLRADRQPDFTQLDMEMSFVEEEDVFAVWERVMSRVFREVLDVELATPFPRLRWADAMARYGVDKPDTRFGLELVAADDWARTSSFEVFRRAIEGGGRVMAIVAPEAGGFSRKEIDGLDRLAREFGAAGMVWWKAGAEGGSGPLARFASGPAAAELMGALGAQEGDLCLFCAGQEALVHRVLGELRLSLGRRLGLARPGWSFLWVTDFPLFLPEEGPDGERLWASSHHPFTAPVDWTMGGPGADPGTLASRAYDLVLNGWELGSGSIRIHRTDVQERVFEILGIDPEARRRKFGFLLDALRYGAPPHGGFALGLDRTVAMTLGLDNIRDVIAFPKTTSAADLMCGAPSQVPPESLVDVHVALAGKALEKPAPE